MFGFSDNSDIYRWRFNPSPLARSITPSIDRTNATVEAKIGGRTVPVANLQKDDESGLTWEFPFSDLNMGWFTGAVFDSLGNRKAGTIPADTKVEITVKGYLVAGVPRTYNYTVTVLADTNVTNVPIPVPKSSLANLSTRALIGQGDRVLIGGFIVGGTGPVKVIFRGQGPGLAKYGITNPAKKLKMELFQQGQASQKLGENSSWKLGPHWRLLQSYQTNPSQDDEPAIAATLWPGAYTTVLSGEGEGVGIIEAFNIDGDSTTRLNEISTRGYVGQGGDQLIAGVVLLQSKKVLIRTQGPTLANYGVTGAVASTSLRVVRQSDGVEIASNVRWADDPANAELRPGGSLAGFAPLNANEAALVITLPAGAYTALVTTPGAPGVGIVEIFEL